MSKKKDEHDKALARLSRILKNHHKAEIINWERLQDNYHLHTIAIITVISALLEAFPDEKSFYVIEAEIAELGKKSRPEDICIWIEGVGIFVLEIKSHNIQGIHSFKNNLPQVIYGGRPAPETSFIDQPRNFAYALKGCLEKALDQDDLDLPAIYFAGWLPFVSQGDVASKGTQVSPDKVWLNDMLDREHLLNRLPTMKNITRGDGAKRESLPAFTNLFGCTSGLSGSYRPRTYIPGTIGHYIDQRNRQLKILTMEQEKLAFSPLLLRGPKVIRGVAGSGKTIVLANAVAECLIRAKNQASSQLFPSQNYNPKILVLCFNRVLTSYLKELIMICFDQRKPDEKWKFPTQSVKITNIDRMAWDLCKSNKMEYKYGTTKLPYVNELLKNGTKYSGFFDHILIDEGQDIDLDWYQLLISLTKANGDEGPSFVIFYDEAQNLYGIKRPGVGKTPPWTKYLGVTPNSLGLPTIMRIGHRNTNEILTFSFNLLLGSFAKEDPQMRQFSEISSYMKEVIPDDPRLNHPKAGKPCIEQVGKRNYIVNFAVDSGPKPFVLERPTRDEILKQLIKEIKIHLDPELDNVDPKDILIMVPQQKTVGIVKNYLEKNGIRCCSPVKMRGVEYKQDPRDQNLFQDQCVSVSTIHSAKGYTAHICHIVFIDELSQPGSSQLELEQNSRALLHVGCTRSTLGLYLWGCPCPLMAEAKEVLTHLDFS